MKKREEVFLEKIYISVTKWTVFIATTLAVIVAILGVIYASKLYYDTKNTGFDRTYYPKKDPSVSFDEVMNTDKDRVERFQSLKVYVYSVIQNGSKGHGYAMGAMPKNVIKNKKGIDVAAYVANGLEGEKPNDFSKCIACHGIDGRGNNGAAPSLIILPIYNHQRALVKFNIKEEKKLTIEEEAKSRRLLELRATRTPQEIKLDHIMTNINKYALHAGQDGTSRAGLVSFILENSGNTLENYMEDYLGQLLTVTDKLLIYGYKLSKKEKFGVNAMDWRSFIKEFTMKFINDIKKELSKEYKHSSEQDRVENDKINRAIAAQTQLMVVGMAIGGAIILFLLLTLILIFIKVEKNTRKDEQIYNDKDHDKVKNLISGEEK